MNCGRCHARLQSYTIYIYTYRWHWYRAADTLRLDISPTVGDIYNFLLLPVISLISAELWLMRQRCVKNILKYSYSNNSNVDFGGFWYPIRTRYNTYLSYVVLGVNLWLYAYAPHKSLLNSRTRRHFASHLLPPPTISRHITFTYPFSSSVQLYIHRHMMRFLLFACPRRMYSSCASLYISIRIPSLFVSSRASFVVSEEFWRSSPGGGGGIRKYVWSGRGYVYASDTHNRDDAGVA